MLKLSSLSWYSYHCSITPFGYTLPSSAGRFFVTHAFSLWSVWSQSLLWMYLFGPYCEREQCELFSLGHGNLMWESPKFMKQELLGRKQSAPVWVFLKTASEIRNWLVYLEDNSKKQGEGAIGKQLDVSHGTKSLGSQCLRYPLRNHPEYTLGMSPQFGGHRSIYFHYCWRFSLSW